MFKTTIADRYTNDSKWLQSIPDIFDNVGEIVQAKRNRNTLRKVVHNGLIFNIKSFHVPRLFNKIVYTFFRKSKAQRSYEHALILQNKGIGTPEPVALLQEFPGGLLGRSYYVCLQLPEDYQEIRYCYWGPLAGNEETLTAFAQFTARLHESGVYHTDYSPGNILWKKLDEEEITKLSEEEITNHKSQIINGYDFQLVDINRMKFCAVTLDMGCRNFARLFECDEIYRFVAKEYAKARGFDTAETEQLIMKYQKDFNIKKRRKKTIKKALGLSK